MDDIQTMFPSFMRAASEVRSEPLIDALRSLPIGIHAAATVGLITGLVLWVFGRRVIHPAFGLVGMTLGGAFGFLAAPTLGVPAIEGVDPSLTGLIGGAVVGLIAAVLLFRVVLAVLASTCIGAAAVLGAMLVLHFGPEMQGLDTNTHLQSIGSRTSLPGSASPPDVVAAAPMSEPTTNEQRVVQFVSVAVKEASAAWQEVPLAHRAVLVLSGMVGVAIGFIGGLFLPKWSASLVTGLFGAAVWMTCAAWLLHAMGWATPGVREFPAVAWLVGWVGLGLIGASAQIVGVRKGRKAQPATV